MATFTYRRNPNDSSKIADMTVVNAIVNDSKKAVETYNKIQELSTLREELSSLNAARGGGQGLKGFIMESLEANAQRQAGHRAIVIDNNGIADLIIDNGGKSQTVQIKCGYTPGQIDFAKYKDAGVDRFMLNRDHPQFDKLAAEAKKIRLRFGADAAFCRRVSDDLRRHAIGVQDYRQSQNVFRAARVHHSTGIQSDCATRSGGSAGGGEIRRSIGSRRGRGRSFVGQKKRR